MDKHLYCHHCGYVGHLNARGVGACEYCHSIHTTLTEQPIEVPPWYTGGKREEPLKVTHWTRKAGQQ